MSPLFTEDGANHGDAAPGPPGNRVRSVRRTLEGVIGVPATEGNELTVLRNGDEIFPAMFEAIDGAEHTVDLLTFVYWTGDVGTTLAQKIAAAARRGVRARVLLDAWGAHPMDRELVSLMEHAGVTVNFFRPLSKMRVGGVNHRTHRKVAVVDEAVGFTGGVGIADEWQGDARNPDEWRDTHFRVRGPAVDGLRAAFLDNWIETDPQLYDPEVDRFPDQPAAGDAVVQCVRGASETGRSDIATSFTALLRLAEERIRITTAYFVPDPELLEQLADATGRGVRVEILVPGVHADKRFVRLAGERDFTALLDVGVELHYFTPTMLHAKVMTVDGLVASIGSANFNRRSTAWDEEVNLVVIDPATVALLDRHFDEDLERSEPVDPTRWERRPRFQRVLETAVEPLRRYS